jgi:hypothetical protein
MRTFMLALTCGLVLTVSAQAAPFAPNPNSTEAGVAPPVELVRDDCGRGWHRTRWRDQWGYWQWGYCVPNEGGYGYDGRGAGWYNPYVLQAQSQQTALDRLLAC